MQGLPFTQHTQIILLNFLSLVGYLAGDYPESNACFGLECYDLPFWQCVGRSHKCAILRQSQAELCH